MLRQRNTNSAMKGSTKGLCLQEFTVVFVFSANSFVVETIKSNKFHRFQKEGVQKERRQNSRKNDKNLSQET